MSRVVVLLHGINTRGVWQKLLTPTLAKAGFVPYPLDYGDFHPLLLLSPQARESKVEWLRNELVQVCATTRTNRVSVVAHSFGAYLIGKILERYPEHEFDKLILVGSIVKRDFAWGSLLDSWRVGYVLHEFGVLDRWPRWAKRFVSDAGDAGSTGFDSQHERLRNSRYQVGHSDYFSALHCEKLWLSTLRGCYVPPRVKDHVQSLLSVVAQTTAHALKVSPMSIRANIFVEQQAGVLSIPQGLHIKMGDAEETAIRISVGHGAAGRAYDAGRQIIAVLRTHWGDNTLPDEQLKRVDPRLKWVISTPISDSLSRRGFSGVVNVDSIGDDVIEEEQLRPLLPGLALHAGGLAELLRGISHIADVRE